MDYGKSAYMRIEELERRLDGLSAPKKESGCFVVVQPDRELKSGRYLTFATLLCGGSATLTVKAALEVFDCGTLCFNVDGKTAGAAEFPFLGKSEGVMLCNVKTDGVSLLSLRCTDGLFARVRRVEVLSYGDGAELNSFDGFCGADTYASENGESVTGVAYCKSDSAYIALFSSSGEKIAEQVLGGGTAADAARDKDGGFAVAVRDCFGGLWGVSTDLSGNVLSREFFGVEGDSVAIEPYGDGFAIAYVREGKVYVSRTYEGLRGISGESEVYFGGKAESVGFVKSAPDITLIIGSKGKIFLKRAEKSVYADFLGKVRVSVVFS